MHHLASVFSSTSGTLANLSTCESEISACFASDTIRGSSNCQPSDDVKTVRRCQKGLHFSAALSTAQLFSPINILSGIWHPINVKGYSLSIGSVVSELGIDQLVMLIDQQTGQLPDFQLPWDFFLPGDVSVLYRRYALFGTEWLPEQVRVYCQSGLFGTNICLNVIW